MSLPGLGPRIDSVTSEEWVTGDHSMCRALRLCSCSLHFAEKNVLFTCQRYMTSPLALILASALGSLSLGRTRLCLPDFLCPSTSLCLNRMKLSNCCHEHLTCLSFSNSCFSIFPGGPTAPQCGEQWMEQTH